jgi:DNA-binding transcriptional MerR regulator
MNYTVGELAKRTGLTVRALHHYEQLGLLTPSGRSDAGYRRYGADDVVHLHRLLALKETGVALKEIAPLLDAQATEPLAAVLQRQIAQVEANIQAQESLLHTLRHAQRRLEQSEGGDAIEALLDAMAMQRIQQRYFSPEEMRRMRRVWETLPPEQLREIEDAWPALIREAQAELDRGTDPADSAVQRIAMRWVSFQETFLAANPGLRETVKKMYDQEPELQRQTGVTPELIAYLRAAKAAADAAKEQA